MEFYRAEPTPTSSWRLAVLMGVNSRTYKFALGSALLQASGEGRDEVALDELAAKYAMRIINREGKYPQAPAATKLGDGDYLAVVEHERDASVMEGQPTEKLLEATVRSIPSMVMQKFHNLRSTGQVHHTFYSMERTGRCRVVRLTDDLRRVASARNVLEDELQARWSIVEASFDAGIGRSLIQSGVGVSDDLRTVLTPTRRVALTSARSALAGFQYSRCFYCRDSLEVLDNHVHVDHVYPYSLMNTGAWRGPDLNGMWNLVLACAPCNLRKSARIPTVEEVRALIARNEAIANSPHPLRRTLELAMRAPGKPLATDPRRRLAFIQEVDAVVAEG
ncbi:HNH endonuclease [Rhodococcus koreensis]|uniref:HNH endonuclease n=1 Tax=Rhodococcus koreensis TaxID=99653 RepID=UPI00366C9832